MFLNADAIWGKIYLPWAVGASGTHCILWTPWLPLLQLPPLLSICTLVPSITLSICGLPYLPAHWTWGFDGLATTFMVILLIPDNDGGELVPAWWCRFAHKSQPQWTWQCVFYCCQLHENWHHTMTLVHMVKYQWLHQVVASFIHWLTCSPFAEGDCSSIFSMYLIVEFVYIGKPNSNSLCTRDSDCT